MTISEGIHQLDGLDWETRDCFSMSRRSTPPADLATPQVCVDLGLTAAAPVVSFPPASAETPRFLWIVKDPNLRDAFSTPFHQLDLRFLKLPRCRSAFLFTLWCVCVRFCLYCRPLPWVELNLVPFGIISIPAVLRFRGEWRISISFPFLLPAWLKGRVFELLLLSGLI